jgi:hypothetical protein
VGAERAVLAGMRGVRARPRDCAGRRPPRRPRAGPPRPSSRGYTSNLSIESLRHIRRIYSSNLSRDAAYVGRITRAGSRRAAPRVTPRRRAQELCARLGDKSGAYLARLLAGRDDDAVLAPSGISLPPGGLVNSQEDFRRAALTTQRRWSGATSPSRCWPSSPSRPAPTLAPPRAGCPSSPTSLRGAAPLHGILSLSLSLSLLPPPPLSMGFDVCGRA